MLQALLRPLLLLMLALHTVLAKDPAPAALPPEAVPALHNTFYRLTHDQQLKVVVIGNSVTAGAPDGNKPGTVPSFYVALERWLREQFPQAQITVVPKIIYAIGPEVQAFRMDERVIAEKPDLVLAEFGAANGAWGDKGTMVTEPATEGFVRRLRLCLPQTDCILMLGIFKTMMEDYQAGKTPASVPFLRSVAAHYDCAVVDAEAEIARRLMAGEEWSAYMKDFIHPGPKGYELYGRMLLEECERQKKAFEAEPETARVPFVHAFPKATLHPDPWVFPKLVPAYFAQNTDGFEIRETGNLQYLASARPDASGSYTAPAGARIVGLYMRWPSGECGNLEIKSGDGWVRLSQLREPHFTEKDDPKNKRFRNFFATYGLPNGLDRVEFRVSPEPEKAGASEVQIIGFFVVERPAAIPFERAAAKAAR